jgi:hypothetical protein
MASYECRIFPLRYDNTETPSHIRFLTYDSRITELNAQLVNCYGHTLWIPARAIKAFLRLDTLMTLEYSLIQELVNTQPKTTSSYIKAVAYFSVSALPIAMLIAMHAYYSAAFVLARATYFIISNAYELSNKRTTLRFTLPKETSNNSFESSVSTDSENIKLTLNFDPLQSEAARARSSQREIPFKVACVGATGDPSQICPNLFFKNLVMNKPIYYTNPINKPRSLISLVPYPENQQLGELKLKHVKTVFKVDTLFLLYRQNIESSNQIIILKENIERYNKLVLQACIGCDNPGILRQPSPPRLEM